MSIIVVVASALDAAVRSSGGAGPRCVARTRVVETQRADGNSLCVRLAWADSFVDALAGGTLSRGPTLLVPQCGTVPATVLAEVRRLGASEVVALGGPGAVCDSVLQQVANA